MLFLIGLLFLSVPVLWGLHRLKVRYVFAWFWTILVSGLVWGGLLALQSRAETLTPRVFRLGAWGPGRELGLVLDAVSGPFALALAGVGLAVVLTSAQRLADAPPTTVEPTHRAGPVPYEDWRDPAATLWLLGVGLLGVLAGNPLTLLLAWAGADLVGVWVLLVRITGREASERIVLDFSARVAGLLLLMWAMVAARAEGGALDFAQIPGEANVFLLLACGFRLGVLPLQVYFFEDLPLRRGIGLMTRMAIPAASSLVLLARVGATPSGWGGILLLLTAFAGVFGGVSWWGAKGELEGRAFWVLGMGALALASAMRGEALAVQAWGLALLLAGSSLFLFSARGRWLRGMVGLSGVFLIALPGMPTAAGMDLYVGGSGIVWVFLLVQALLLAGFVRHFWREGETGQGAVRAIRGAYALGLLILPGTLALAGGLGGGLKVSAAWWAALVAVVLAGGLLGWRGRREETADGNLPAGENRRMGESIWSGVVRRVFSFHWLYRLFWRSYRMLGGGVAFISVLLEGEAGILWTLLLLFLLISLIASQAVTGG